MHGSVREGLENLLAAQPSRSAAEATEHIVRCTECARELDVMRSHARFFKSLQPPATLEPSGGFYARVMQRIEEGAKRSIWWVFVYSPIGKRLAYTSLALALALGSYMVSAESLDGHLGAPAHWSEPASVQQHSHFDPPITGNANERRQAVLANFVSHPAFSE